MRKILSQKDQESASGLEAGLSGQKIQVKNMLVRHTPNKDEDYEVPSDPEITVLRTVEKNSKPQEQYRAFRKRPARSRPVYRVIRRLPHDSYKEYPPRARPEPDSTEIKLFLQSLQSIAFAKYNEIQTEKPTPGKQEQETERISPNKGKRAPTKNQKLKESARLIGDLISGGNSLDDLSPRSVAAKDKLSGTAYNQRLDPTLPIGDASTSEPTLDDPSHENHALSWTAPDYAQKQCYEEGLSAEEIEQMYSHWLKPSKGREALQLEQLNKDELPKESKIPNLSTFEEEEDQRQEDNPGEEIFHDPYPQAKPLFPKLRAEEVISHLEKEHGKPVPPPFPEALHQWIPSIPASNEFRFDHQVYHILGFDAKSKYLAYKLSTSLQRPPVRLLVRDPQVPRAWEAFGSQLTLYRGKEVFHNRRVIPETVPSVHPGRIITRSRTMPGDRAPIKHLFVTTPGRSAIAELRPLVDRINKQTTIVLLQDGLGIPEELNYQLFHDPATRPSYIEGHIGTLLYSLKEDPFAVREVVEWPLYLSTRMKDPDVLVHKFPDLDLLGPTRLLQSLTTIPELKMVACARAKFLFHKLPSMMATCLLEPLSVFVDGRYAKIPQGYPNNRLIEKMLMEMCAVASSLPEFRNFPAAQHYFNYDHGRVRERCLAIFKKKARTRDTSKMWRLIKDGKLTDIRYLNGYFSRRGEEMGIRTSANDAMISLVKAKHESRLRDLKNEIMFEGWTRNLTT